MIFNHNLDSSITTLTPYLLLLRTPYNIQIVPACKGPNAPTSNDHPIDSASPGQPWNDPGSEGVENRCLGFELTTYNMLYHAHHSLPTAHLPFPFGKEPPSSFGQIKPGINNGCHSERHIVFHVEQMELFIFGHYPQKGIVDSASVSGQFPF